MTAEQFDQQVTAPKRARFWELQTELEQQEASLSSLYASQSELAAQEEQIRLKRKALEEKIKRAELPLLAIKREKAEIARSVFKVGQRPEIQ